MSRMVLLEAVLMCLCTPPMIYYRVRVRTDDRAEFLTIGDLIVGFTCLRAYQLVYVLCCSEIPRDRFYL